MEMTPVPHNAHEHTPSMLRAGYSEEVQEVWICI